MEIRRPNRVTRTYTQRLIAPPERVLPLLCPVREADWIEGWDPRLVISQSGVAERDCVFTTAASPHEAIWMVVEHDPAAGRVGMVKISPEMTACRLSIELWPAPHGSDARVTYTHTSLGPRGDAFVEAFNEEFYLVFMRDWERRLNHYLETGSRLSAA